MSTTTDNAIERCDGALFGNLPPTVQWVGGRDGELRLLDQTLLPGRVEMRTCKTAEDVWHAIRVLCVRGAPAIGVAAGYGVCVGMRPHREQSREVFTAKLAEVGSYLCSSRPTAVNLAWAVQRVGAVVEKHPSADAPALWDALLAEAHAIAAEDAQTCRQIGMHGSELVPDGGGVLTHCNAGALATSAYGTALSALYVAHEQGKRFRVFADETRPLLQGARLTAFELNAAGLDVSVLCDNAAASLMRTGQVDMVIVGADRIAGNGDVANKIGTYGLAILARHHEIPFYVAAPWSTFDLSLRSGEEIPIEQRDGGEVCTPFGTPITPVGIDCYNPAFDVTPASLVTAIITEKGILKPVSEALIRDISA